MSDASQRLTDQRRERRGTDPDSNHGPSMDVLHDILSKRRRRRLLVYLVETEAPVTLEELVAAVATAEAGAPADTVDDDVLRSITLSLVHSHLPRLDDAGVVAFDPDRDRAELAVDPSVLTPYL
ncbi:DUF7344 domain-containing protein [Halomarina ordinaria]|uniref:DUF7344 domain-containing protein n=1 Tax=Halomarina ordinaria TaxID=3033939 RepID=A0ABD5U8C4_9EURY|nr:hypothetical protein [Halomarina sp. PSRA2]